MTWLDACGPSMFAIMRLKPAARIPHAEHEGHENALSFLASCSTTKLTPIFFLQSFTRFTWIHDMHTASRSRQNPRNLGFLFCSREHGCVSIVSNSRAFFTYLSATVIS